MRRRLAKAQAERDRAVAEFDAARRAVLRAELLIEHWTRQIEEEERLTVHAKQSSLNSVSMTSAHRIALSKSASDEADRFGATVRAAGYTIRSLAKAVGVSPTILNFHRKPKGEKNSVPIPQARADKIQELTGWKADARHWPAGIS